MIWQPCALLLPCSARTARLTCSPVRPVRLVQLIGWGNRDARLQLLGCRLASRGARERRDGAVAPSSQPTRQHCRQGLVLHAGLAVDVLWARKNRCQQSLAQGRREEDCRDRHG